jgi:hypothetical protein
MHLVVNKITLSKDKKIEAIELSFDVKTESYFFVLDHFCFNKKGASCASEGVRASEGMGRVVVAV